MTRLQVLRRDLKNICATVYNEELWNLLQEYIGTFNSVKLNKVEGAATGTTFQDDDLIGLTSADIHAVSVDGERIATAALDFTTLEADGEITFNEDKGGAAVFVEYYPV
jgi:hypothetical protein